MIVERQKHAQADRLKGEKEQINRDWREKAKEIDGVVDEEVIREVVSKMTGVPLKTMNKDETARLLKMEDELHKAVISQHEAIRAIAKAVRKSRARLETPKCPIGSCIFAGPTGVGKTLLASLQSRNCSGPPPCRTHFARYDFSGSAAGPRPCRPPT